MSLVNKMIIQYNFVTTQTLHIFSDNMITDSTIYSLTSGGVDKLVWRWYGFDLYLSHATCQQIGAFGGAGISIITAIIVAAIPAAAPVAGIVAAVISGMLIIIQNLDAGNGVVLKMTITGVVFWIVVQ